MAYPGYPFTTVDLQTKRAVWNKAKEIDGFDPDTWRRDICGHSMQYTEYGNEGDYGWEIDHINPRANGGQTTLDNLQPLWWQNNRRKGDTYPWSG
mgnify:CR=1 FL=1